MKDTLDRNDSSIENVLRMLKPILERKQLVGKQIELGELTRICRNHRASLPVRDYGSEELAGDLQELFNSHIYQEWDEMPDMGIGSLFIADMGDVYGGRAERDYYYVVFDCISAEDLTVSGAEKVPDTHNQLAKEETK